MKISEVIFLSTSLIIIFAFWFNHNEVQIGFLITNLILNFVLILGIIMEKSRHVSLVSIFYFAHLFLFGLIPIIETSNNVVYWTNQPIDADVFVLTNIISILGIIFFWVGTKIGDYKTNISHLTVRTNPSKFLFIKGLLLSSAVYILVLVVYEFNYQALIFRFDSIHAGLNQTTKLLVDKFIRVIPILIAFIFLHLNQHTLKVEPYFKIKFAVLFTIGIFSLFPLSVPRYVLGIAYIPFVLEFFPLIRDKYIFKGLLLFGLFIIFPFVDQFRFFFSELRTSINFDFLSMGHFDAYQNFARAIEIDFISYGEQFLGVIFFMIPRSIWPEKPTGSGKELASQANLYFDNISFPFIGEGYVNFGLFGLLSLSFIGGFILKHFDIKNSKIRQPYYYFLLGWVFFMVRGDLMSSFAYIVGLIFAYHFVNLFLLKKKKIISL